MKEEERQSLQQHFESSSIQNVGGVGAGGSIRHVAENAGQQSRNPPGNAPKRSVRIAEATNQQSPTYKTKQATIRINEARNKTKVKVKYF